MWLILLEKRVDKTLEKAPREIREKFEKWKDIVHVQGPTGLHRIRGFRDHPLIGEWSGARSSRLNEQWRVIYFVVASEVKVLVLEVTPHDYRKKG